MANTSKEGLVEYLSGCECGWRERGYEPNQKAADIRARAALRRHLLVVHERRIEELREHRVLAKGSKE